MIAIKKCPSLVLVRCLSLLNRYLPRSSKKNFICSGRSKGWPEGRPPGSKFFQFHTVFGKIVCCPPPGSWRPLLGEILDPPLICTTTSGNVSFLRSGVSRCSDFNQPHIFRAPWTIFIVVSGTPFL